MPYHGGRRPHVSLLRHFRPLPPPSSHFPSPRFPVRHGRRSRGPDPFLFTARVCIFIAPRKRPVRVDSDSTTRLWSQDTREGEWGCGESAEGLVNLRSQRMRVLQYGEYRVIVVQYLAPSSRQHDPCWRLGGRPFASVDRACTFLGS